MKFINVSFKRLEVKAFLLFLLVTAIPLIYKMKFRFFFYDDAIDTQHYSLMHNAKWILLVIVVATETLFFPLVSIFGSLIKKGQYLRLENSLKIALMFGVIIFTLINGASFFIFPYLSDNIDVIRYLRSEVLALSLLALAQIPLIFFYIKERKHLIEFIIIQLSIFIVFDLINSQIANHQYFLLPLGEALSYVVLIVLELIILTKKYHINIFSKEKLNFVFLKRFLPLANHAFVDAVIIDVILILFYEGIGFNFGIADFNSFETTVILLPASALMILTRSELAVESSLSEIKNRTQSYALVSGLLTFAWSLIFVIFFLIFGENLLDFLNLEIINFSLFFSFLFVVYNLRAVSNIYKSAIYGIGELHYLTLVAVKVAIFVFLPIYIISNETTIQFSATSIMIIAAIGMLMETILTISYFYIMLRRKKTGVTSTHHVH